MKKATWLRITIPIMAVLIVIQPISAMMGDSLDRKVFQIVHGGGGMLLVVLVLFHIGMNWNWVENNYFKRGK